MGLWYRSVLYAEPVEYWRVRFDWRAQEARLNAFSQYKVPLHGIDLHFLHVPGNGPDPFPCFSPRLARLVFEFLELIPRLTDPERFGGDPADAFTVVAPSLPGYGLSFTPGQPRFGIEAIADCFAELMKEVLGYGALAHKEATGAHSSPPALASLIQTGCPAFTST